MQILNPNAKAARAAEEKAVAARKTARTAALKQKRSKAGRAEKAKRTIRQNALNEGLEESFRDAHQKILDEIKAGLINQEDDDEEEDEEEQWGTWCALQHFFVFALLHR